MTKVKYLIFGDNGLKVSNTLKMNLSRLHRYKFDQDKQFFIQKIHLKKLHCTTGITKILFFPIYLYQKKRLDRVNSLLVDLKILIPLISDIDVYCRVYQHDQKIMDRLDIMCTLSNPSQNYGEYYDLFMHNTFIPVFHEKRLKLLRCITALLESDVIDFKRSDRFKDALTETYEELVYDIEYPNRS